MMNKYHFIHFFFIIYFYSAQAISSQSEYLESPLEKTFQLSEIGKFDKVIDITAIDNATNQIALIDVLDDAYFLSFLTSKEGGYELRKRISLASKVTSNTIISNTLSGNDVLVLGLESGHLLALDMLSLEIIYQSKLSERPINSLNAVSWESGLLAFISGDEFMLINVFDEENIITRSDKAFESFVLGSFTHSNSQELMSNNGNIYTITDNKLTKISELNEEFLSGEVFFSRDENDDGIDEVYVKSGNYIKVVDTKNMQNLQSMGFSNDSLIMLPKNHNEMLRRVNMSSPERGTERMSKIYSYCVTDFSITQLTEQCYDFSHIDYEYYHRNILFFGNLDNDQLDDIIFTGEGHSNSIIFNINDNEQKNAGLPKADARCVTSILNGLAISNDDKLVVYCVAVKYHESAMSGVVTQYNETTSIDIESKVTLYNTGIYPDREFEPTDIEFELDINSDGQLETIIYSYYRGLRNHIRISPVGEKDNFEKTQVFRFPDDIYEAAEKVLFSHFIDKKRSYVIYVKFKDSIWQYTHQAGLEKLTDDKALIDIERAAYNNGIGIFAISKDGSLHLLNHSEGPKTLSKVCTSSDGTGVSKSTENKLIYSCLKGFGQFDTISNTVDWHKSLDNNPRAINTLIHEQQRSYVTSGSNPAVYQSQQLQPAQASIPAITVSVPIAKPIEILLDSNLDSDYYFITTVSNLADIDGLDPSKGRYVVTPEILGTEQLSYVSTKGDWQIAEGLIDLEVYNTPPEANALEVSTHWRTPIDIQLQGTDADGHNLDYQVDESENITWINQENGLLKFSPSSFNGGSVAFKYTVSDGYTQSNETQVAVMLTNTTPEVSATSYFVNPSQNVKVTLNAVDADNDPLQYNVEVPESLGDFEFDDSTGELSFVAPDTRLTLEIPFSVTDGVVNSETAVISVTVNKVDEANTDGEVKPQKKSSGSYHYTMLILMIIGISFKRMQSLKL